MTLTVSTEKMPESDARVMRLYFTFQCRDFCILFLK